MDKARQRFSDYWNDDLFEFISHDIDEPIDLNIGTVDYVLHMASNTHPVAYSSDPIGTVTTNIVGTKNMLDFAVKHHAQRFVFVSSCEGYGENKRCGETLCQTYKKQRNLGVVILRFPVPTVQGYYVEGFGWCHCRAFRD